MSRKMKDSGVEWIGEIPEDWETHKIKFGFSEVNCKNTYGLIKNALKFRYGTIVRKENFDAATEEYVADTILNYNVVKPGDIMINGLNLNFDFVSIRSAIVENIGVITSAYLALRPNEQIILPYYANYLFRSYDICKAFHNMGIGMRKTLAFKEFKNQPCIFPSPTEQQQIVHFLDRKCTAIDTAIEKTKKSIEKLEEYKKAVITKAVTKGIDPNAKMKDSGVEWIGEMPEGWEITRNKFYVIISHGMDPKTEGDIPVYGSGAESFKSCGEYKEGPAVLLGRKGATLHIPHYITGKYWNVDTAFDVKTKSEDMGLKYFYFLSMCFNYNYYIAKTTLPSMTQFDYCNMRIPLPSRKEQDIIVSYIEDKCVAIDTAIEKKKKAIEKWEEYKKSLIYDAVTGKIDCRNEVI